MTFFSSDSPSGYVAMQPAFSPLYQQICQSILNSLQAGEWKPQQAISSEMELAKRYNVSQGTVRKAIDALVAENLLVRRQGKGTFVASFDQEQTQYRFMRLHPDTGTRASAGRAQRQILECRRIRATAELARGLQLRAGDTVLQVRRVLSWGGVPTVLEDIWLPAGVFRGLTAEMLADYPRSSYALFEKEFGVRMIRAEEKLRATLPDAQQAELLQVPPHTALLQVERISYTYNDRPMEMRQALNRTDLHHYRNTLT